LDSIGILHALAMHGFIDVSPVRVDFSTRKLGKILKKIILKEKNELHIEHFLLASLERKLVNVTHGCLCSD
jgi:hypothetical protein